MKKTNAAPQPSGTSGSPVAGNRFISFVLRSCRVEIGMITIAAITGFWLFSLSKTSVSGLSPEPQTIHYSGLTSEAHAATIADAEPLPALTVISVQARQANWSKSLEATGAVAAWQEASVGSRIGGVRLTSINASVGDVVKKGQVLARLDNQMLLAGDAELKASVAQSEAALAQAEANRQRALRLKDTGSISEQDILQFVTQANSAQAQLTGAQARLHSKQLELDYTNVVAPDDGVIVARSTTLGAVVPLGAELFRMIRQNRLEWRAELTPVQLQQVQSGQNVTLSLPDGSTAKARIRQLSPSLDSISRLGTAYADIAPGSKTFAGMYLRGQIALTEHQTIVVPASSVVIRDGRSYIMKLQQQKTVTKVKSQVVTTGQHQGQDVEIIQGLQPGDKIAGEGAGFLNDGDVVRVVSPTQAAVAPHKG